MDKLWLFINTFIYVCDKVDELLPYCKISSVLYSICSSSKDYLSDAFQHDELWCLIYWFIDLCIFLFLFIFCRDLLLSQDYRLLQIFFPDSCILWMQKKLLLFYAYEIKLCIWVFEIQSNCRGYFCQHFDDDFILGVLAPLFLFFIFHKLLLPLYYLKFLCLFVIILNILIAKLSSILWRHTVN